MQTCLKSSVEAFYYLQDEIHTPRQRQAAAYLIPACIQPHISLLLSAPHHLLLQPHRIAANSSTLYLCKCVCFQECSSPFHHLFQLANYCSFFTVNSILPPSEKLSPGFLVGLGFPPMCSQSILFLSTSRHFPYCKLVIFNLSASLLNLSSLKAEHWDFF